MAPPSRRQHGLSVALPGSLTLDIPHLREKTTRLGFIARALGTFRIDEVIVYRDRPDRETERETRLIEKMLTYIETPQYLRKILFKMDPDLQYAGTIPPLRTPNHPDRQNPRVGAIREGVIVQTDPYPMVQAGFKDLVRVPIRVRHFERVTLRLTRDEPPLEGEIIEPRGLTIYWGFKVARGHVSLEELVRSKAFDMTISTSRKGSSIREIMPDLTARWKPSKRILVAFGSPSEGIPEILAHTGTNVSKLMDFNLNTVPEQGVETVRTEEAVWATLSALNMLELE